VSQVLRRLLAGGLAILLATAGAEEPVHVAVGDSLAVGMGASPSGDGGFVSLLTDQNPVCREDRCPDLELVNLASPGATSAVVVTAQLGRAVEVISDRDVALVTVTVGGNDLFSSVFGSCRQGPTEPCRRAAGEAFAAYLENLDQILGELRAASGPDTPIVTMTLYNPFPACLLSDLAPAAEMILEGGATTLGGFNDLIRIVVGSHGVAVAETTRLLSNTDYVGGLDCIHPNASGHEKLAAAFGAALGSRLSHPAGSGPLAGSRRSRRGP
jgi:lysophospholipase L1-like esterase